MHIHRYVKNGVIVIDGCQIVVPRECSGETYFKLVFGKYELPERILLKYIEPSDSVLELGGSIGVVSNVMNQLLDDKTNHVVVEPNPLAIFYSELNRNKNKSGYNLVRGLVGDGSLVQMNLSYEFIGSSQIMRYDSNAYSVGIVSKPLNEFINLLSGKENLVLVMDIEGGESVVVKDDGIRLFNKIIVERHPNILLENDGLIDERLEMAGFVLKDSLENVQYWCRNIS